MIRSGNESKDSETKKTMDDKKKIKICTKDALKWAGQD